MTYDESLAYLQGLGKFGINLGLQRIKRLLALMDNPERRFRIIHVTGTNGKGSVTAMLAAVFKTAGIRAAMYTSPHLNDYTERMIVDGQPVSREQFAAAVSQTSRLVAAMVARGEEHPTEFEVLTAAAFACFAAARVEYAVVEVGLGGLLDSTNVVSPEVAIITNVALDHTDRCGPAIADIARHKAGIIKPGVPVVTAARGEALTIIARTAAANNAALYVAGRDFSGEFAGREQLRQTMILRTGRGDRMNIGLRLLGRHQVENAAVAAMAALLVVERDKRLTPEHIKAGLAGTVWPGRFEVVSGNPPVIIDGAHNPAGVARLRETLDEYFPGRAITFLLGILRDKDVQTMVDILIRPADTVVVAAPDSNRAGDPAAVAGRIKNGRRVETAPSIAAGVERVWELAGPDGLVCIAGSLYLVGGARRLLGKVDK